MADFTQTLTISSAGKEIKVSITSLPTDCNISAATDSSSWITVNKPTTSGSTIESVFNVPTSIRPYSATGNVYISATTVNDNDYDGNISKTFDGTINQERNPRYDAQVGMIAYYKSGSIKYIHYLDWESSLGIPIGVCVIPSGHSAVWGDGKARYISVTGVNPDGSQSSSNVSMAWGPLNDTTLTNYTELPTWDNTIGGTVGSRGSGYISSDDVTGTTNVIDTLTKYKDTTWYMIPSPYSGNGAFYADYKRTISGNNALSDFNGKSNTTTLVGLGTEYSAANACYKYKTSGTSAGDWYLPACGELGYIAPRLKIIKAALSKCGGPSIVYLTSSTEYASWHYYRYSPSDYISAGNKVDGGPVRPFIAL